MYSTQTGAEKDLMTPRKVWDKALEARRMIQNHFSPIWMRILNASKGVFPSGQSAQDVLNTILDEEYARELDEKGKKKAKKESDEKQDAVVVEDFKQVDTMFGLGEFDSISFLKYFILTSN
jgi:hypothetical protein